MSFSTLPVLNCTFPINATTLPITGVTGAVNTYVPTAFTYSVGGKVFAKATQTAQAVPSEANGIAHTLATGRGTVIVWGVNAAGTISVYRGSDEVIDSGGNFVIAVPSFPYIPDTVAPVAYTVLKNNTGSAVTIGSTNWSAFTSVSHQNVMVLPERPQAA